MAPPKLSPLAKAFTAATRSTRMSPRDIKAQIATAQARGMTQSDILAHCLRRQTPSFASTAAEEALQGAVVVGLDAEWYEYESSCITELGVSIIAPDLVDEMMRINWRSPWDIIKCMINYHVCIKKNIHMVNSVLCPGYPDKFQFGTTTFVEVEEAQKLLRHAFVNKDADGQPRPVIFVGHAVDNDIKIIKDRFDFDIEALGVVVATIDTQVLAVESGHAKGYSKIRLRDLLCRYDIDEDFLHNAGNDTVCTMIAAVLMAYRTSTVGHSAYYKQLKRYLDFNAERRFDAVPQFGIKIFCRNCASNKHFAKKCPESVFCRICADHPTRDKGLRNTHRTWQCLEHFKEAAKAPHGITQQDQVDIPLKYPLPCSFCIESTDADRYAPEYAYGHLEKDCDHQK